MKDKLLKLQINSYVPISSFSEEDLKWNAVL